MLCHEVSMVTCTCVAGGPHYHDVIMSSLASQITSLTIVYSTVYSRTDQGKHQSSASLAFVRGIHRWPVNSPHKGPVTNVPIWWRHHASNYVMLVWLPSPENKLITSSCLNLRYNMAKDKNVEVFLFYCCFFSWPQKLREFKSLCSFIFSRR